MIRLENIKITFGANTVLEKKALRGVSLAIDEGDFITVIGSNGAGKSTLLNAIAGDCPPSSGRIFIDDADVTLQPTFQRSAAVARVFQDPLTGTCGDLSIEENLSLALSRGQRRGFKWALTPANRSLFEQVLKRLDLGLENRLKTSMSLLSGGQRQAISLLMATLSPLKILLLDEHTSALDPKTAEYVLKLTQSIVAEKNITALMVTHSLQQALKIGNRTVILHNGKILLDINGDERARLTPQDLLAHFGKNIDDDRLLLDE